MMRKTLFKYAVLLHTKNEKGEITDTEVIIEPNTILGKSEKDVVFKITRLIPDEHAQDPDNVQILVGNF